MTYSSLWQRLHNRNQEPALVNIIVKDRWGALKGIWTVTEGMEQSPIPSHCWAPLFFSFFSLRAAHKTQLKLLKGQNSPKATQWPSATIKGNVQKHADLHRH